MCVAATTSAAGGDDRTRPAELTGLGEKILMSLWRDPQAADYPGATMRATVGNALEFLEKTVPGFRSLIAGKVLDFGCGWGHQAVAMAKIGPEPVRAP